MSRVLTDQNPWTGRFNFVGLGFDPNIQFTRPSVTTLRLTRRDTTRAAYIWVFKGDERGLIKIDADYDCVMTVTGIGGIDDGSEDASTGYAIHGLWNGTAFGLIARHNDAGALTKPAGYDWDSGVIAFGSNNGGGSNLDLLDFVDLGGGAFVYLIDSVNDNASNQITNDTVTALTMATFVPDEASWAHCWVQGYNGSATDCVLNLYLDSGGTQLWHLDQDYSTDTSGDRLQDYQKMMLPIHARADTSIYGKWSIDHGGSQFITLAPSGFILPQGAPGP